MSDDTTGSPPDQTPPTAAGPNPPPNWGSAYPSPPPAPPQYGQPQYGQQPYGQPYPQQPYPQQPYGQPAYGGFTPTPPKHGQATTSMVLGIISLAGLFTCLVPILLAPAAWILGAKAVKEIDANPAAMSGRGEATAGKIMGIIGTVILSLILIGIAVLIVIGVNGGFDDDFDSGTYDSASSAISS